MADGGDTLLTVPTKATMDMDWVGPLKSLFKQAKIQQNFDQQLIELHKLRQYVLAQALERSVKSLEALQRYHDQVAALEVKVPSELLKMDFTWFDAFDKGSYFSARKSMSLPFITFEQMCVQFNIAALQSQLAAEGRVVDTDEELKTAAKWLQSASGIFGHLSNLVTSLPEDALTSDLHPNTLLALSALMLAQAQEIFVQKAIKGKMKDSIIAKLCVQAEDMFSDALIKMTKENVKHQFDRTWLTNIAGKQLSYAALAQFFQSKVCSANKSMGEEISRLNLALDLFKKAQEKTGNLSLFSYYVTEGTRLQALAKKDNDFIYHEVIPSTQNLATIEKVATARLAKPTVVNPLLSSTFKDLFELMYPILVNSAGKPMTYESDSSSPEQTSKSSALPSPLKQVVDASLSAMSNYLLRYLEKQQQQPPK